MSAPANPHERVRVHSDGRPVVEPPVEIDMYTVVQLREDLAAAAALSASGDIVVEMTRVQFLDSMGVGALCGAWKRARQHSPSGRLYVVGAPERIKSRFRITGVARFFAFADTLADLPVARETRRLS